MKCFLKKDNNASYELVVHCIENTFVPDVSCHLTKTCLKTIYVVIHIYSIVSLSAKPGVLLSIQRLKYICRKIFYSNVLQNLHEGTHCTVNILNINISNNF